MKYTQITQAHIDYFINHLGAENILVGNNCAAYGSDETENLNYPPDIVLFPHSTKDVSIILKYCNNYNIAVTPSGALTGLSGGAIPVFGGVSLSMKKMNKVLSETDISAVIEMALSDDVSFNAIREQYGLTEEQVKKLMKKNITHNSYKHWRKRVKLFSDRRKHYK
mgnify:CR=1 FL=1